ncbi:hypothetical protein G9A89_014925 [Geosiphon pyriformis]|nr:hypothetical protein G9A89_014925 [Geosiphon pyriformis]
MIYHQLLIPQKLQETEVESNKSQKALLHKWCTRVNSLLSSKVSGARWAGVSFVKLSIEQSEALYVENLSSWSLALLNILTRPEPIPTLEVTIATLSELFARTINRPELQRELTSQFLPRFNACLLDLSENKELLPSIFQALSRSVSLFPSIFRPFVENAQNLCLLIVNGSLGSDTTVVKEAANCLAKISRAGGKSSPSEQWRSNLIKLMGSMHQVLDKLFDSVDEESQYAKKQSSFELPPVSEDYILAFPVFFERFKTLSECMVSMLSSPSPHCVQIPVNKIINLLCRVFNICEGTILREHKEKNEFFTLMIGVPTLHLAAIEILASLILSVGDHLLHSMRLINEIIMKLLNQYRKQPLVRTSIYYLAKLCIQKYGIGFLQLASSPLIYHITEDLIVVKRTPTNITEGLSPISGKKAGKKKKTQITNSDNFIGTRTVIEQASSNVQFAALETLNCLLPIYGESLSASSRATIDKLLLTRILDSTLISHTESNDNEHSIQLKLHECLLASAVAASEYQPSIITHALRVFTAGLNSHSYQIQLFCSQALTICDLIYHPRLPSIARFESTSTTAPPISLGYKQSTLVNPAQEDRKEEEEEEEKRETKMENHYGKTVEINIYRDQDVQQSEPSLDNRSIIQESCNIAEKDGASVSDKEVTFVADTSSSLQQSPSTSRLYSERISDVEDDFEIPEIVDEGPDSEFEDDLMDE